MADRESNVAMVVVQRIRFCGRCFVSCEERGRSESLVVAAADFNTGSDGSTAERMSHWHSGARNTSAVTTTETRYGRHAAVGVET